MATADKTAERPVRTTKGGVSTRVLTWPRFQWADADALDAATLGMVLEGLLDRAVF